MKPLAHSPSHRILAIRRAEKEGYLVMDINIDKQTAVDELEQDLYKSIQPQLRSEVKKAIGDSVRPPTEIFYRK